MSQTLLFLALFGFVSQFFPQPANAPTPPTTVRWIYINRFDAASLATLRERVGEVEIVSPDYFAVQKNGDITGADRADIRAIVRAGNARLVPLVRNEPRYAEFSPLIATVASRAVLAARLAKLALDQGYDGLNIDFEGLLAEDRANLTAFVQELSRLLRAGDKLATVAVPPKPRELYTGWAGAYDYEALGAASDYLVLMTYGARTASDPPGSLAPQTWVQRTAEFAVSQTSPRKLLLGIGLWGLDWNVTSGGPAITRTNQEIEAILTRPGTTSGYSTEDESAWVRYRDGQVDHIIWYENRRSIEAKLAVARRFGLAGWAAWRLGQEGPSAWQAFASFGGAPPSANMPDPSQSQTGLRDWPISGGRFYTQASGRSGNGLGYPVTDEGGIPFWREFRRLGGVEAVGYPISTRFLWHGFVTQAFQKAIFQWAPEAGQVNFVNVFDELSRAGKDGWLLVQRSTPRPIAGDIDAGKTWDQIVAGRLAILDQNPSMKAAYLAIPDPIRFYGLPTSDITDNGNHTAIRLQRAVIQHWKTGVPWARAGSVTIANGGDIAAEAGLIPETSRTPVAAN